MECGFTPVFANLLSSELKISSMSSRTSKFKED